MNPDEKRVQRIWWNGANGDSSLETGDGVTLTFVSEYKGDRDDLWVLEYRGGREVSRHNVRYIATIEWGDT